MNDVVGRVVALIVIAALEAWLLLNFLDPRLFEWPSSSDSNRTALQMIGFFDPLEPFINVAMLALAAFPLLLAAAHLREIAAGRAPPASGQISLTVGLAIGPLALCLVPLLIPLFETMRWLERQYAIKAFAIVFVVQLALVMRVYYRAMFSPATKVKP